ncbi:MAG: OmpA family protein [Pseudomonadota bacterium]
MFRPAYIFACVCFIMAGVGAWYAADQSVKYFEHQTEAEISTALNAAGFDWARVRPDGLRVALTGLAPTEVERFRALEVITKLVDPDRVENLALVIPPKDIAPPRFTLEVLRSEDRISLIGLVPKALGRDQILRRIEAITEDMTVTDMLETADHGFDTQWLAALDYGLENIKRLPRSKISITADQITVTAVTESVEQQQSVKSRLALTKPDNVDLYLDISAPRPVIAPFRFRLALNSDGAELLSCSSDTEQTRQRILSAVASLGVHGKLRCEIGLGVPTTDWAEAIEKSLDALQELGGGNVAFSDADITLIASDTATSDRFETVIGRLESDLPELFTLNAILPPKLSDNSESSVIRPSELIAELSLAGKVRVTGRIDNTVSRTSVMSVASAMFGSENVEIDTLTDPDLPGEWPVRALAAIKALQVLEEGTVVVQPEKILISGRSLDEEASSEIDRILATDLGGRGNYEINVVYDESLLPAPEHKADQACEDAIMRIMTSNQIAFDPGSVILTKESERTLSIISEEFRDCPDARFEIQGHTDSQGPDDLNLEISQSRAETVLSGLLNRRVLIDRMLAKGYGPELPIADNETEEGRAANRRIVFVLQSNVEAANSKVREAIARAEAEAVAAAEAAEQEAAESASEEGTDGSN